MMMEWMEWMGVEMEERRGTMDGGVSAGASGQHQAPKRRMAHSHSSRAARSHKDIRRRLGKITRSQHFFLSIAFDHVCANFC